MSLDHVGIGYHIVTRSGKRHNAGFTWHSPRGDYAAGPPDRIGQLQAIMDELLRAAAAHEGNGDYAPGTKLEPVTVNITFVPGFAIELPYDEEGGSGQLQTNV